MTSNEYHLEKLSHIHYKSIHGYFLRTQESGWVFIPFEQEFSVNILRPIIDALDNLNFTDIT
jgi:hypothetical protein